MIQAQKLAKKPKIFKRLTGITPDKFNKLVCELEPLFRQAEIKRKSRSNRQRKIGAGGKCKLTLEQNLFLLLLYYRTYVNHVFIGMIGGIDDSNVGRNFHRIDYLLARIFRVPEKKIDMSSEKILELIVDATEQESERRKGSGYSGKKKRQTIKTQIIVTPKGLIKSVSKTVRGNIHDKKLYDQTKTTTNKRVKKKADLGYLGTSCQIPIKKSKHKKLTDKQKEYNNKFSKERIIVEHVIAHLKKFKILAYRFRNPICSHNLIFKNIAGLRNYTA